MSFSYETKRKWSYTSISIHFFYTITNDRVVKSYNVTNRNTDTILKKEKVEEKKDERLPKLTVPRFLGPPLLAVAKGMTKPIAFAAPRWQLAHLNAYNCLKSSRCLCGFLKVSASCHDKLTSNYLRAIECESLSYRQALYEAGPL